DPACTARAVFQRIDHAAIWLLIASTFTPVHVMMFRGAMRWAPLAFIWTGAVAGIVLKTIFFEEIPESVGLALYLGFAWLGRLTAYVLARTYWRAAVMPLLRVGAAYSLGGIASVVEFPALWPGYVAHHELFHVAVLVALVLHWRLMRDLEDLRARDAVTRR